MCEVLIRVFVSALAYLRCVSQPNIVTYCPFHYAVRPGLPFTVCCCIHAIGYMSTVFFLYSPVLLKPIVVEVLDDGETSLPCCGRRSSDLATLSPFSLTFKNDFVWHGRRSDLIKQYGSSNTDTNTVECAYGK